jgi:hypothetical protein
MSRRFSLIIAVLALLAGCAGSAGGPDRWRALPRDTGVQRADALAPDERCPLAADATPGGRFRLALAGTVDPAHAPVPETEAETHVFRNLYETLVRIDCNGEAMPALAASWAAFDGGRTWVIRLRPGAAFWDGMPVRAAAVIAGWPGSDDYTAVAAGADTLVLHLRTPSDTLPLDLAHPALAVARPTTSGWPVGTGPCRPLGGEDLTAGDLVLVPNPLHPRSAQWERVTISLAAEVSGALLETQCDAVVVRDAGVRRPGLRTAAMPWDVVYLLVVPTADDERTEAERERWTMGYNPREFAGPGLKAADDLFLVDPAERLCESLPVRVRPLAWPSFDWPGATASHERDLILYPKDDPVAQAIAVAVAQCANTPRRPGRDGARRDVAGRGPLTPDFPAQGGFAPAAVAVPPREFTGALQSGRAGAYVLPWPRRAPTACGELAGLLGLAGWLQDAAFDPDVAAEAVPSSARAADPYAAQQWVQADRIARRLQRALVVTPMVRSRSFLVTRAGLVGLVWDFDGALDLSRAGWATRP